VIYCYVIELHWATVSFWKNFGNPQNFNCVAKRFPDRCVSLQERLREIKCCTRKSRIAPAESTVCCPPERRCGAICRRAFSCCKCSCKRADTQQRTKNTRAKHSLTSVAPPPLSEVREHSLKWELLLLHRARQTILHPYDRNLSDLWKFNFSFGIFLGILFGVLSFSLQKVVIIRMSPKLQL